MKDAGDLDLQHRLLQSAKALIVRLLQPENQSDQSDGHVAGTVIGEGVNGEQHFAVWVVIQRLNKDGPDMRSLAGLLQTIPMKEKR